MYRPPGRPRIHDDLRRHRGRLLRPSLGGRPYPTAYNADGLIVAADDAGSAQRLSVLLGSILDRAGCRFDGPAWISDGSDAGSVPSGSAMPSASLVSGVRIRPEGGAAPDPWTVVAQLRAEPELAGSVGLNHLLTTPERVGGNPFAIGHGSVGLDRFGVPAQGRGVVAMLSGPPRYPRPGRRPRVAVLDTAIGQHAWFDADRPADGFEVAGTPIGQYIHPHRVDPAGNGASDPIEDRLLGTLASRAGHGTFIAGLLRQMCPEAAIVDMPIMDASGVVPEHLLIRALDLVLAKQRESPGWADAVVLSLGYYSEDPDDAEFTSGLKRVLLDLGRSGVAVFASAGNDSTSVPCFPAAFAADPDFADPEAIPVVSVAALNPDGTVAIFANDGPWVTAAEVGVNVVSSIPAFDGSAQAAIRATGPGGWRSAIDPDDFTGGFASWSGSSFATPVAAARYLNRLLHEGFPDRAADRRSLLPLRAPRHPPDGRTAVMARQATDDHPTDPTPTSTPTPTSFGGIR